MKFHNLRFIKATALVCLAVVSAGFLLAQPSAGRADTLDKIKKEGKLTVGTEAAFPPFEFVKDGKIVGYGKDVLDYIVKDLGVELVQLDVPFPGIYPGLLAGKFDFVATTLLMSENTTKKFAFTMPIAEGSSSILRRKGDTRIKGVEDFNGKVIATQLATGSEKQLRDLNETLKSQGKPGFELKLFNSSPEAFLALANRQVDAATSLLPMLRSVIAKQPDVFELVGRVADRKEYLGWAARPEDKRLRDYLSSKIKELRDSGRLYEWQEKWFGFRMEIPDSGYTPAGGI